MRFGRSVALAVLTAGLTVLACSPASAQAQPPGALTAMQIALACAIPPEFAAPRPATLRIIGAQDPVRRGLLSDRDLLVIEGGTGAGLQLGQRFFVRRPLTYGDPTRTRHRGITTAGWIRVVAVNEVTAIASVDYACGDILTGDYLDPFTEPVVPDGADRVDTTGELDFAAASHVLFGAEESINGGVGSYMLIETGTDAGVAAGARFAIYRDVSVAGMPLASVGEGVIVSAARTVSVLRINAVRDAVHAGDLAVPRKP